MTLAHSTFTLQHRYKADPASSFQAFADPATKALWFDGPSDEWKPISSQADFRVGGREHNESRHLASGRTSRFDAVYHDIVDDERIVFSYEMRVDDVLLSVSLTSVEFASTGTGTLLTLTEQGVYFDDNDNSAQREEGVGEQLDALGAVLDR